MSKFEITQVSRSSGASRSRGESEMLEFGFSISAVADDHWCRYVRPGGRSVHELI
jgi:hypothetical protein